MESEVKLKSKYSIGKFTNYSLTFLHDTKLLSMWRYSHSIYVRFLSTLSIVNRWYHNSDYGNGPLSRNFINLHVCCAVFAEILVSFYFCFIKFSSDLARVIAIGLA